MKLLLFYHTVLDDDAAATVHASCDMLKCTALPFMRIYALFLLLKLKTSTDMHVLTVFQKFSFFLFSLIGCCW